MNLEQLDITGWFETAFFRGMKATYNGKCYISCLKLLVSAIDSMAFLATGDNSGKDFRAWLDRFCDLSKVNITSEELWEHRNAVLHMTSLESRKIKEGKVKRILPVVAKPGFKIPALNDGERYYLLWDLIVEFSLGVQRYVEALNSDDTLKVQFCTNYPKLLDYDPMHRVDVTL